MKDISLWVEFGDLNTTTGKQAMTVYTKIDGTVTSVAAIDGGGTIDTTPLGNDNDADAPITNTITLGGQTLHIFAGPREVRVIYHHGDNT